MPGTKEGDVARQRLVCSRRVTQMSSTCQAPERNARLQDHEMLNLISRSRVAAERYFRLNLTVSFSTERSQTAPSFGRKMIWYR